ncbi:MAG: multidrug effflux MFS transporter [Alphaproteobacteria bacterium]|nr:multidrug effflux MFS transporter [Alphaproteobacteria bacterium]
MTPTKPLPYTEFLILLTLMISIVAMAIDMMLPALALMGNDLGVERLSHTQLIISFMFGGFALGQFVVGPLSDSFGRKPLILGGYILFLLGCLVSLRADTLEVMLVGRFLQGLGAAGPRVISMSLIRDLYADKAMARIMSFIMTLFFLISIGAPLMGQAVIMVASWRYIFGIFMALGALTCSWMMLRQPETHPVDKRLAFSLKTIWGGVKEVVTTREVMGNTLALGVVSGPFIAYLASSRQVFQDIYQVAELFPVYFGISATAIAAASLSNARLVKGFSLKSIAHAAFVLVAVVSAVFVPVFMAYQGVPPLPVFMAWLMLVFFGIGLIFGNLTTIAMQPVGHLAGIGAAVVGSLSTFMSLPLAYVIGQMITGSALPLPLSFALLGTVSLLILRRTNRR